MDKNQTYHLEAPYGLVNDPNAFLKYNGLYYLFFQWNPLAKDHSNKVWGYFTSHDLLNWDFKGQAIRSNSFYDRDGVYSGTGFVYDDKIYLYYTGNVRPAGKRKSFQCAATSEDGGRFIKEGILIPTPAGYTEHIRDPKVFIYNNQFYMLLAAQEEKGTGAIILCTGTTPMDYKYIKPIATTKKYEMVECPDIAFFEGKAMLAYALQHRNNETDQNLGAKSYYKVVTYDFKTNQLSNGDLDENEGLMDEGFDFYVPQTLKLEDGRTIMVAWMSNMSKEEELVFGQESYNIHCFTMFREVGLDGNRLVQKPMKEYQSLLGEEIKIKDGRIEWPNRQWRLKLKLNQPSDFSIDISNESKIEFSLNERAFNFSRINWITQKWESRDFSIDEIRELEVWSDTSSLEIYINGGKKTVSSRINPTSKDSFIQIESGSEYSCQANVVKPA